MSSIQRVHPELTQKPWGLEVLVARTPNYTGKVLFYRAGQAGGLQYHVEKDETFYLHKGEALVRYDRGDGVLRTVRMREGQSYHVPPGAVHQVEARTDCVMFESSTPHFDDRVSVEDRYP